MSTSYNEKTTLEEIKNAIKSKDYDFLFGTYSGDYSITERLSLDKEYDVLNDLFTFAFTKKTFLLDYYMLEESFEYAKVIPVKEMILKSIEDGILKITLEEHSYNSDSDERIISAFIRNADKISMEAKIYEWIDQKIINLEDNAYYNQNDYSDPNIFTVLSENKDKFPGLEDKINCWLDSGLLNLKKPLNFKNLLKVFPPADMEGKFGLLNQFIEKGFLNLEDNFEKIFKEKDQIPTFETLLKNWIKSKKIDPLGKNREILMQYAHLFDANSILREGVDSGDVNLNLGRSALLQMTAPITSRKIMQEVEGGKLEETGEFNDSIKNGYFESILEAKYPSRVSSYSKSVDRDAKMAFCSDIHIETPNFFKHICKNADKIEGIDLLINEWIHDGKLDLRKAQNFQLFCENANKIPNSTDLIVSLYEEGFLSENKITKKELEGFQNKIDICKKTLKEEKDKSYEDIKDILESNSIINTPLNLKGSYPVGPGTTYVEDGHELSDDANVNYIHMVINLEKFESKGALDILNKAVSLGNFDIDKNFEYFYEKASQLNNKYVVETIDGWVRNDNLNLNDIENEDESERYNPRLYWIYKTKSMKSNVIFWILNKKLNLSDNVFKTICREDIQTAKNLILSNKISLDKRLLDKISSSLQHPSHTNSENDGFEDFNEFLTFSVNTGLNLSAIYGIDQELIDQNGSQKIISLISCYNAEMINFAWGFMGASAELIKENYENRLKAHGLGDLNKFIISKLEEEAFNDKEQADLEAMSNSRDSQEIN